MVTPHYSAVLARETQYLPDAQAARDMVFMQKAQALSSDPIANLGGSYLARTPLLEDRQLPDSYRRETQRDKGIKSILGYMGLDRDKKTSSLYGQRNHQTQDENIFNHRVLDQLMAYHC